MSKTSEEGRAAAAIDREALDRLAAMSVETEQMIQ
jgi:hypothetical protein